MSSGRSKQNGTRHPARNVGRGGRPSLTRAETIDSCTSEDLVTVVEVRDRKPFKVIDRKREVKKGVMAESLNELIERGKEKLSYQPDKSVYVVLEEDGTEVDDEEYFQTLPENTLLMLLILGDKWSPFGPPSMFNSTDETDFSRNSESDILQLLEFLLDEPGHITMLSGKELELLAEMDPDEMIQIYGSQRLTKSFLEMIQIAADRHLREKTELRDALGLLKLYHKANFPNEGQGKSSLDAVPTSNGKYSESKSGLDSTSEDGSELSYQGKQNIDESSTEISRTTQRKRRKL